MTPSASVPTWKWLPCHIDRTNRRAVSACALHAPSPVARASWEKKPTQSVLCSVERHVRAAPEALEPPENPPTPRASSVVLTTKVAVRSAASRNRGAPVVS